MISKEILGIGALTLSIVNGLMLLRHYLRDRAKLVMHAVHPDIYQWWFQLPSGKYQDNITRKYGFLVYITISNRGLRNVSVDTWHLCIKTCNNQKCLLKPLSIPIPKIELKNGENMKIIPVLGQSGLISSGETMVVSGGSISGITYFVAESYGGQQFNPKIDNGNIEGEITVQSVFGKKINCRITFHETPLEEIKTWIKGIEKIG